MSSFIVIDFVYGCSCKSFLKIYQKIRSSRLQMFFKIVVFQKFRNIHRKKPVSESHFNDAMRLGLQLY